MEFVLSAILGGVLGAVIGVLVFFFIVKPMIDAYFRREALK